MSISAYFRHVFPLRHRRYLPEFLTTIKVIGFKRREGAATEISYPELWKTPKKAGKLLFLLWYDVPQFTG